MSGNPGGANRRGAVGKVAASLVALLLAAAGMASALEPKDFAGQWNLDPSRTENLEKAVDRALEPENFFTRMVARKRILRVARSPRTMNISQVGEGILVTTESHAPPPVVPGGAPVIWMRPKGSPVKIRMEMDGNRLVQVFETDAGNRLQRFSVSADGKQLSVDVEVSSPRLQRKVGYRVAFVRAGGS